MADKNAANLGVVDTHCHLWKWEQLQKSWSAPGPIARTFTAQDLAEHSMSAGVRQCVVIEAGMAPEDNQDLEQFAASSALIAGMVPFVDLQSPKLGEQLDYWQSRPKFSGIRMRAEAHSDPEVMVRSNTLEGFAELSRRKIPFDFLVTTEHLSQILKIYERVPSLIGVIEHIGKPDLRHGTDFMEWSSLMEALAKHTNVYCKASIGPRGVDLEEICAHLGEGWPVEQLRPYLQLLLEEFGPQRLMWGSDWPLALLESDYKGAFEIVRAALGFSSPADETQVFRTTAAQFYRLRHS